MTLKPPKHESGYAYVNDHVYKWFLDSARLLPKSGPVVQSNATQFATELILMVGKMHF